MPKITVEIELDTDTGAVMVGMVPEEGGETATKDLAAGAGLQPDQGAEAAGPSAGGQGAEAGEESYMRPAKDVATALQVAGDMLQGSTGAQSQAANAEGDFRQGFSKGAGAPAGRPMRPPQVA